MQEYNVCIAIPTELQKYRIVSDNVYYLDNSEKISPDFGVKLIKNEQNELEFAAYYSPTGELLKRIYYKGSSVSSIVHYRNNSPYTEEFYNAGNIQKRVSYDTLGNINSSTEYYYDRNNRIVSIKKKINKNCYVVEYGFDELGRVNSRKININTKTVNLQTYTFDILDRTVEYKDNSQRVKVHKINKNGELIHYSVNDIMNNNIEIINKFLGTDYIGTEIILNGHKTNIKNKIYTDNALLKRPYASEDDLEYAISSIVKKNTYEINTKRTVSTDICNRLIYNKLNPQKPLPITIRKQVLLMR